VEAALTGHWRKFPLKTQKITRIGRNSRKHWRKFPLETQKITQNALTGPAHRPGEKGEKKTKKEHRRQAAEELKTRTRGNPVVFPYLGRKRGRVRKLALSDS
jgi:hypothetical protein